ncbi:MAG: hypothetical protein FWD32_00060 [Firmicutes bacterium]|nr:hypothetical protein [Bacillota bacterium]
MKLSFAQRVLKKQVEACQIGTVIVHGIEREPYVLDRGKDTKQYYLNEFFRISVLFIICAALLYLDYLMQLPIFTLVILGYSYYFLIKECYIDNGLITTLMHVVTALICAIGFLVGTTLLNMPLFVYLQILAAVPITACLIYRTYNLVYFLITRKLCKNTRALACELSGSWGYDGPTGAGKTTHAVNTLINHSQYLWTKYRDRYFRLKQIMQIRPLYQIEYEDYQELKVMYDFYTEHTDIIPCCASNAPIFYQKDAASPLQVSLPLKASHFLQEDRMPPNTDGLLDEAPTVIEQRLYLNPPPEIREFCARLRHNLGDEVLMILTNQNASTDFKPFRDARKGTIFHANQKPLLKPKRLEKLHSRLLLKWQGDPDIPADQAEKIEALAKLINAIGFRRWECKKTLGGEGNETKSGGRYYEYGLALLDAETHDRQWKKQYQCREKAPTYDRFKDMFIEPERRKEILTCEVNSERKEEIKRAKKKAAREKQKAEYLAKKAAGLIKTKEKNE